MLVRPKAKLQAERLLHKSIAKHSTAYESTASRPVLSMRSCEAPALPAGPIQRDRSRRLEHTRAAPRPEVRWRARTGARAARREGGRVLCVQSSLLTFVLTHRLQKAAATLSTADQRAVRHTEQYVDGKVSIEHASLYSFALQV